MRNDHVRWMIAAMPMTCAAFAGPPVQYTPLSDVLPAEFDGLPVSDFRLTPEGRIIARARVGVPDDGDYWFEGLYVIENGQWTEIVPPVAISTLTQPGVWAIASDTILSEDRIVVVLQSRVDPAREYTVREYQETSPGEWSWTEIVTRPPGVRITDADQAGSEWRWTEYDWQTEEFDYDTRLYRLSGGMPEFVLDKNDVRPLSYWYENAYIFGIHFLEFGNPDRVFIRAISSDLITEELDYHSWTLDGFTAPEYLGSRMCDDWGCYGSCVFDENRTGGLILTRSRYNPHPSNSISWSPSGPSLTPAFTAPIGDPPAFTGLPFWPQPLANDVGRVVFPAIGADGLDAVYVGPDQLTDRIWHEGETLHGQPTTQIKLQSLSERDQFLAEFRLGDNTTLGVLAALCPADVNRDGLTDNGDIGDWITLYLEGSLRTDFNNDGILDNGDIGEFIAQFLNGC